MKEQMFVRYYLCIRRYFNLKFSKLPIFFFVVIGVVDVVLSIHSVFFLQFRNVRGLSFTSVVISSDVVAICVKINVNELVR